MNTKRSCSWVATRTCAIVLAAFATLGHATSEVRQQWRLIPVELPGVKETRVSDFAIGADGVPWVLLSKPDDTICYWQDGNWYKFSGDFTTGTYLSELYTSPGGKVYLTGDAPSKPRFGRIYLLEKERATFVTDYYFESAHLGPKLYFDDKGRIWNWGKRFLAKFEDGEWDRVEAKVGWCRPIEDADGNLYFFGREGFAYYRDGELKTNVAMPELRLRDGWSGYRLWGDDKVLFFGRSYIGMAVLDLKTMQVGVGPSKQPELAGARIWDMSRDKQGDIWLLVRNHQKTENSYYIRLSAEDGRVEELLSTMAINTDVNYHSSLFRGGDGTVYFAPRDDGVYVFRDGKITHTGWQEGLVINDVKWICERSDGTIWFASRRTGIAVYDPQGVPGTGPSSPFQRAWKEYQLAARATVKDFEGNLWFCLKDKPNKISKWDGQSWEHLDLGFDTTESPVRYMLVDNLNRIYMTVMGRPLSLALRFSDAGVENFRDGKEMLVDSVKTGSREFRSSSPRTVLPPVVTKDKKIWCSMGSTRRLSYYDGTEWYDVITDISGKTVFRHKDDAVLINMGLKFFVLDRGQLVEFENEHTREKEYLLGETGIQLFDKTVYEANKGRLYPMRRAQDAIYLFENLDDFHNLTEGKVPDSAIKLSKYLDRIWLADGGFWAHDDNLSKLHRYYDGLMLHIDLAGTPVGSTLSAHHCDAYEDRAGDFWLRDADKAFHVKRPSLDTTITIPKKDKYEARKLRITFAGTSNDQKCDDLSYSWRLDGGEWSAPSKEKFAELRFDEPAPHEFQVMSIGEMGNVDTTPAALTFNVLIPLPEVRIVSTPDELAEGPRVVIKYEVVKRQEDSQLSFQWRLDGGKWNDTFDTKVVISSLEDGKHVFEVRAIEDNKYVQPKPARVEFAWMPDLQKIIVREIERLKSGSYAEREKTAARLVSIGDKCLAYLKAELEDATAETEWWLKHVIWQIEH